MATIQGAIKEVPDNQPNAEGVWRDIEFESQDLPVENTVRARFDFYNTFATPGHHVVAIKLKDI